MVHYPKKIKTFKNNVCKTFSHVDEDGTKHWKDKVKFDKLDDAIAEAKRINAMPKSIHKLVGYKCTVCHKYHTGRNGKLIKN